MTIGQLPKDELVKAEIISAAQTLFQKYGMNKTTMEDIAHETGKGKSTLYYYFKSKEEVFYAVAHKGARNINWRRRGLRPHSLKQR